MTVDVDTHSLFILKFDTGAIGSMTISFDNQDSDTPQLEICGTEGTICISDFDPVHGANNFHGSVGTALGKKVVGNISHVRRTGL